MTAVAEGHRAPAGLSKVSDEEYPQSLLVSSRSELLQVADEQGMTKKPATLRSHHLIASSSKGKWDGALHTTSRI
jgi:hypothetical protein